MNSYSQSLSPRSARASTSVEASFRRAIVSALWMFGLLGLLLPVAATGEEPPAAGASSRGDLKQQLEEAANRLEKEQSFLLRYKFAAGETVRWKAVHLATTETTIRGRTQTSRSRSRSTKVWHVTGVDDQGNITLTHTVTDADMWQQIDGRPEVRYNSQQDDGVPPEYELVAASLNKPLTTVTFRSDGTILQRKSDLRAANFGLGDIVMLLPPKPVRVGSRWYEPSEIRIRLPDGRVNQVKIRKRYRLDKVATGIATISVKTEVLTPINDPRIEAQLVQQLTNGFIKFDLEAGRVRSRQMDWDETVVGFSGADSMVKYLARFTEELLPASHAEQTVRAADPNEHGKGQPAAKMASQSPGTASNEPPRR